MKTLRFKLAEGLDASKFRPNIRYLCLKCRDSGWAEIFHPKTVAAAVVDPDAVKHWLTCLVRCTCSAPGPEFFNAGKRKGSAVPVLGEKPWHILANSPTAKAEAAGYVHRPEGYNDEFSSFEPPEEF